jgi:hypothetical protein
MLANQIAAYESQLVTTSSRADILVRSDGHHATESANDTVAIGYDSRSLRQGICGGVGATDILVTLLDDPSDDCFLATVGKRTATTFELRTWGLKGGHIVPATRFGVRVSWIAFGAETPKRW